MSYHILHHVRSGTQFSNQLKESALYLLVLLILQIRLRSKMHQHSTRGPGLQVGVKPDVAAYGGAGGVGPGNPTGMRSITSIGISQDVVGTSFAAPLISRLLAGLDRDTQGGLGSEALRNALTPFKHSRAFNEVWDERHQAPICRIWSTIQRCTNA